MPSNVVEGRADSVLESIRLIRKELVSKNLNINRVAFAALLITVGLLGGVVGFWAPSKEAGPLVPLFLAGGGTEAGSTSSAGYASIVKRAIPAVASVSSSRMTKGADPRSNPFPPGLREFFGDLTPRPRREQGLGSAVIVSPEGYLLTNNHVVEGAEQIEISLEDGRQLEGKIVGADPKTDIAVLKIDAKNLPVLPLADSDRVEVGDFVLAIGNPFGVGQTVTFGIASATSRGGLGIEEYEDFIQTDAAINPGNSGGALINVRGELIGINTAILGSSGGNLGVGFAVPSNMARQVMEQILKQGRVIRGYLGVVIQEVRAKEAKAFGLGRAGGALVGDVNPDGPAAKSGLKRGDIILSLSGEPVSDVRDLRLKIAMTRPGSTIRMKIFREGVERDLVVTLGEMPVERAEDAGGTPGARPAVLEGMAVQELSPQIAQQLGLPANTRGVVVANVEPGSAAAQVGLQRGDVIQQVNRRPVSSVAEFNVAVRQAGKEPLLLLVNRQGTTSFVVLDAP